MNEILIDKTIWNKNWKMYELIIIENMINLNRNTIVMVKLGSLMKSMALEKYIQKIYITQKLNSKIMLINDIQTEKYITIGKYQDVWNECNIKNIENDKINLLRRDSGGGTIYIDQGVKLFSIISKIEKSQFDNMPIILNSLTSLGLNAEIKGRNDICINNKKVSGNSYHIDNKILKHHGTILLNVDKNKLDKYINHDDIKLKSKSITNYMSRVINISDIDKSITDEQLNLSLINSFQKYNSIYNIICLDDKYLHNNYDFNNFYSLFSDPNYIINNKLKFTHKFNHSFTFGICQILFLVHHDFILDFHIFSDGININLFSFLNTEFKSSLINKKFDSSSFQNISHSLFSSEILELTAYIISIL